ncbi:MAG TPA: hypothetical protein VGI65_09335 [Steroidobacteraceae bacterium]
MAATSRAGDGVQVMITNDGTEDILVTVYDMDAGQQMLLQGTRINGFTSVPILAVGDARGRANLSWTAASADPTSPRCGHGKILQVANDSAVNVHADTSCKA